jgi:hypothetical protein
MNTNKFETVHFSTLQINPGINYRVIIQRYKITGMTLVMKKTLVIDQIKKNRVLTVTIR